MIKYFLLIILLFSIGCIKKNNVYYCGDHVCKNKKEAKTYFENNLVLEVVTKKQKKDEAIDLVKLNTKENNDLIKREKKLPFNKFFKKENKTTNKNITAKNIQVSAQEENKKKNKQNNALYKFLNKERQKDKKIKADVIQKVAKIKDNQNILKIEEKTNTNKKIEKEKSILEDRKLFKITKQDKNLYCDISKDCDIDVIANEIIKNSKNKNYPNITSVR